jgi:hypothetical protein
MPGDFIGKWISPNVTFNRAIFDETVRLGKSGKEADRLAAAATEEASDKNEQGTKALPAQISAVVAQGPKCLCATTMGTLFWWPHLFVETFCDISFWINIDGADQLHEQLRLPL